MPHSVCKGKNSANNGFETHRKQVHTDKRERKMQVGGILTPLLHSLLDTISS